MISDVDNIHVRPLFDKLTMRNLTAVSNIVTAISNIADFPWGAVLNEHPVLRSEFDKMKEVSEYIVDDPLIVLTIPGFGSEIQHLAYFTTQLLIELGNDSLKQYRGVANKSTAILNKEYYDRTIQKDLCRCC